MPTLTYLGHACFLFETEAAACLIDPWLSPRGAFLGAWRQLPPNDHCTAWMVEKMREKPVLIYVTHEHGDHYDEETLRQLLPHAAGICIPDFASSYLRDAIATNLGAEPILLAEDEERAFHDIRFRIFVDESGINRDSAIFIKAEGLSFFDGNDCKLFDRAAWIAERCGRIDVLSSQFSGANMHPICYDMPQAEYRKVSLQKRMRKFVAVRNLLKALKPRCYVPSAGPAVFPFPEHNALNFQEESIFPKWWDLAAYLKGKIDPVAFLPLDVLGAVTPSADGTLTATGEARPLADEEISGFVDYYRRIDAAAAPPPAPSALEVVAFFEREMNAKLRVLADNPAIRLACPIYFEITQDAEVVYLYRIDPGSAELRICCGSSIIPPYYVHRTSVAALARLMTSGKGWGTYFLSFLFRSERVPDVFDSAISTLFFANSPQELDHGLKRLAAFRTSSETVTLSSPDGAATVRCKRFCPHQGADLTYASFDGRYVVCPRHRWRFDCENGGKADASDDTIDAQVGAGALSPGE